MTSSDLPIPMFRQFGVPKSIPPVPPGRLPEAGQLRLRESLLPAPQHPALTLDSSSAVEAMWAATCRIVVDQGPGGRSGSGFFINDPNEGSVVVTNAHVVDGKAELSVERIQDRRIVPYAARLIAIDYPHDLAILKCRDSSPVPALELGTSPKPGDEVWLCGYPLNVETPRLARGVVSGYDVYQNPLCDAFGVAVMSLDATVNLGNSGGPVCDLHQQVVGVTCAVRPQLLYPPALDGFTPEEQRMLIKISAGLQMASGIGYALDPLDIRRMLGALGKLDDRVRDPLDKINPKRLFMTRREFAELQMQTIEAQRRPNPASPIGVFSFDLAGRYYLDYAPAPSSAAGAKDPDRVELPANDAWRKAAAIISPTGGSFVLRGYDVVLYRRAKPGYKRGIWVLRASIEITD